MKIVEEAEISIGIHRLSMVHRCWSVFFILSYFPQGKHNYENAQQTRVDRSSRGQDTGAELRARLW